MREDARWARGAGCGNGVGEGNEAGVQILVIWNVLVNLHLHLIGVIGRVLLSRR
jgi:hypothetical protein